MLNRGFAADVPPRLGIARSFGEDPFTALLG
jgi:hypothetical protein